MLDKNELAKQHSELTTLKVLVKVYGEIAAHRMNQVREEVLFSRRFLEELESVFEEVRRSYVAQLKVLAKYKKIKGEKVTLLAHNGKTVAVFLSANTKLYGDLVQRTFEMFVEDVEYAGAEATVVGNVGLEMFKSRMGDKPVSFFAFPDNGVDRQQLAELVKHLVKYEAIHVYYGKFTNVITQEPMMYPISAEIPLEDKQNAKPIDYLFEPSLEAILMYFETEIFGTLLEQTVRESQLAKYAARLTAMDRAEQNVEKRLKGMQLTRMKLVHRTLNRKQLNSMGPVLRHFGRK
jgi:F-type H+-transporting ATPase subunit gamma